MSARVVVAIDRVSHSAGQGALRTEILHEVSASVHAGEIVLLTGPSGSGKTTLLTLVGALRAVQQGSLSVLGHELHAAPERLRLGIRRQVGWVFQLHNLLRALTVRQNVPGSRYARACRNESAPAATIAAAARGTRSRPSLTAAPPVTSASIAGSARYCQWSATREYRE